MWTYSYPNTHQLHAVRNPYTLTNACEEKISGCRSPNATPITCPIRGSARSWGQPRETTSHLPPSTAAPPCAPPPRPPGSRPQGLPWHRVGVQKQLSPNRAISRGSMGSPELVKTNHAKSLWLAVWLDPTPAGLIGFKKALPIFLQLPDLLPQLVPVKPHQQMTLGMNTTKKRAEKWLLFVTPRSWSRLNSSGLHWFYIVIFYSVPQLLYMFIIFS